MIPTLSLDPFSDSFLSAPFEHHKILRDAGPVFYLDALGVYGMARYRQVFAALGDHDTFCSARGVGLLDFSEQGAWRSPSLLLETDLPLHQKMRAIMNRVLTPSEVREKRDSWGRVAEALVDRLVRQGRFDAITDLAEVYPLAVFPDAVGLRSDGRENLLPYAAAIFNTFGPRNALFLEAAERARDAFAWVDESRQRQNLSPGGWGAAVFSAADRGECSEEEASLLVRSFLAAGLDTTINAIGNLMHGLVEFPDQWQLLRKDRSLVKRAVEESLRWGSTAQTFFRTTTRSVSVEGCEIPEGAKVLLFLGSANRDPERWLDPDRFEVMRVTSGHLAFGYGIHQCMGQMVARLEAELLLTALVDRVSELRLAGRPEVRLNNTLRSLAHLPVECR